ncbi:MAG: hypothetical protein IKA02_06495 [Clostridia bacterium]|nr:hypothetical protein [Clostridia bacterium]
MKNSSKTANIVWACVLLVIGILFCFSMSYGVKGLSYIIGISIILTGVVFALNAISKNSSTLSIMCFFSSFLVAFGIVFIGKELASIVIDVIPWMLIVVGVMIFIDAFLLQYVRRINVPLKFVIELALGILLFIFGLVVKFNARWGEYSALVLGIALIVYGIYLLLYEVTSDK